MDNKELALAIQQLCEEKGLTVEDIRATIEDALAAAYRKDFGDKKTQNIKVTFDIAKGKFDVFDVKEVVEDKLKEKYEKIKAEVDKLKEEGKEITEEIMQEIQAKHEDKNEKTKKPKNKKTEKQKEESKKEGEEKKEASMQSQDDSSDEEPEEEKKFNPRTMISLSEAKEIKKSSKLGSEIITKLEVPSDFGRMAAQTAKQVIIQKIREAERNTVYENYKDKVGELIVGTVQRQEGKVILVDLGTTTGIVLPIDQIRTENYPSNARMKFYVKSVEQTNKGPEVLLSRSHPEALRKLFKLEVPEINSGAVVIKAIARDAGARSKIAVQSKEEDLDPIGACIGQRGTRVGTIINELNGEKIDVIEWDENKEKFIANALAPAKIISIKIDEENRLVKALVAEDQYSLAIGKGGQNVRLAAQLVGMKIDVVMEEIKEPKNEKTEKQKEDKKDKVKSDKKGEIEKKEIKEDKKEDRVKSSKDDNKEQKEKKEKKEKEDKK